MELNLIIASNLKRLRTLRGLSLGQLSELCGVSKVMLCQIEKGESNPTINTIWKIANGLKVPYTHLIDEVRNSAIVIRKEETSTQLDDTEAYRISCYFADSSTRTFELFHCELDGHASYDSIGHPEKSEEYILVDTGTLTIETCNIHYHLNPGDAICFDASKEHIYINDSDLTTTFTVINYYPSN